MFCTNCGNKIEQGSTFCNKCGAKEDKTFENARDSITPTDVFQNIKTEQGAYPGTDVLQNIKTEQGAYPGRNMQNTMQDKVPGSIYLWIGSVSLIISAAMSIVLATVMAMAGAIINEMAWMFGVQGAGAELDFMALFMMAMGFLSLVIAGMGLEYRNNLAKAGTLMSIGIVVLVLNVLVVLTSISLTMVFSLVFPVCYVYGAYLNKEALGRINIRTRS